MCVLCAVVYQPSLAPEVTAWAGDMESVLGRLSDLDKEVEKAKAFINMSK